MIAGSKNGAVVLDVEDVTVTYDGEAVLGGLSFSLVDRIREGRTTGQVVSLLGPSGVGKTTLLRVLAGLEEPDAGAVRDADGAALSPRSVGLVFQDYPLFAHRTVEDNLTVAGRIGGLSPSKTQDRVRELLARIGLEDRARAYPVQLSGGQRQRVAIAQQLVVPRRVILLDEPFSGLDPTALASVSELLLEVANEHELNTVVIVTHDVHAALAVSDTVLLLGRGESGASVVGSYDLVDLDLAWKVGDPRDLADLALAIEARFQEL